MEASMTPARSSLRAVALMLTLGLIAALPSLGAGLAATGEARTTGPAVRALPAELRQDVPVALARLDRSARSTAPGAYPWRTTPAGPWETTAADAWTSGFWPGCLWAAYELTGDPTWRRRAEAAQAGLGQLGSNTGSHDIGFQLVPGFTASYRLGGAERDRRLLLEGAQALATRYRQRVGAIRSWGPMASGGDYKVIIDNLMNLELLFWAARHGGSPMLSQIAHRHALTSARDLQRPDGGTYHVAAYDPATGRLRWRGTSQGAGPESTWSRGQAWAIYGFTLAYRETGDPELLRAARLAADYWLARVPDGQVPPWDFQAPGGDSAPRDTSAAAVAASGLLDLADAEPDPLLAGRDEHAAERLVVALASPRYLVTDGPEAAILREGTEAAPAGHSRSGLVYGDYYFLQALVRMVRRARAGLPSA
jgi:unsaturated chondroitin disaccharide hydrolase